MVGEVDTMCGSTVKGKKEMFSCPHCREKEPVLRSFVYPNEIFWYVECGYCYLRGPLANKKETAVFFWNILPRFGEKEEIGITRDNFFLEEDEDKQRCYLKLVYEVSVSYDKDLCDDGFQRQWVLKYAEDKLHKHFYGDVKKVLTDTLKTLRKGVGDTENAYEIAERALFEALEKV